MKFDICPEYITPAPFSWEDPRNKGIKFIRALVPIQKCSASNEQLTIEVKLHGILCMSEHNIPKDLCTDDYYKYSIIVSTIADNNAEIPAGAILIFRKALPKESIIDKISIDVIDFNEFLIGITGELQKEFSDPIAKCNQFINAVKVDNNSSYEVKWPGIAHY